MIHAHALSPLHKIELNKIQCRISVRAHGNLLLPLFVRIDAPPRDQSCSGIAQTQIFVRSSASAQGLVFTEYRKKGIDYENF